MKHRKTLSSQDRNDRLLLRIAETAWRQPWHVEEKPGVASTKERGGPLQVRPEQFSSGSDKSDWPKT